MINSLSKEVFNLFCPFAPPKNSCVEIFLFIYKVAIL